jgi:hypothetical protein
VRPSHRRHNRMWPRRRASRYTAIAAAEILRELWPSPSSAETARPWPYKLAYARHWISSAEYYAVKPVPTGRTNPGIGALLFAESPMFRLIKKTSTWSQPSE